MSRQDGPARGTASTAERSGAERPHPPRLVRSPGLAGVWGVWGVAPASPRPSLASSDLYVFIPARGERARGPGAPLARASEAPGAGTSRPPRPCCPAGVCEAASCGGCGPRAGEPGFNPGPVSAPFAWQRPGSAAPRPLPAAPRGRPARRGGRGRGLCAGRGALGGCVRVMGWRGGWLVGDLCAGRTREAGERRSSGPRSRTPRGGRRGVVVAPLAPFLRLGPCSSNSPSFLRPRQGGS